jgi:hypothetical protein
VNNQRRIFGLLVCGAFAATQLAGCGTNGNAQIPSITQAPLSQNALQLAVGTARIGQDGNVVGLNVVATLRQPNGLSGVLADQPTLTGPAGFTVSGGAPGAYPSSVVPSGNVDAGTAHISGSPQVPLSNANLVNSTLGTFTGVFSYGFGPFNCDQNCTNISGYYPGNPNASGGNGFDSSIYDGSSILAQAVGSGDPTQPLPFFSAHPFDYLMGPPAVPFFNDGTFPIGFTGYSPGFTDFEMTPVAGQYSLTVNVAAQNAKSAVYNATATLSSTAALGPITVTDFTGSAGGGTGHVTVPAGVTETLVFIVDVEAGLYYTVGPLTGTGSVAFTLPGNLGPCVGSGCQSGANAAPSLTSTDDVAVAAVGFDYPAFEAAPPGNRQQKPTIAGANGQADLTASPIFQTTEP